MKLLNVVTAIACILIFGLALASAPGCAGMPETASKIQIGDASATLPKQEQFKLVSFKATNPDGSMRELRVENSSADPAAALNAYVTAQAKQTELITALVNKIPTAADLASAAGTAAGIPPLLIRKQ